MVHLPGLRLLLLCQITCLLAFFFPSRAAAKQQCRLQHNNNVASNPSTPTGVVSSAPNSSSSPSATSSSPTPSRMPFNYGTDTIRGVNLGGWFVLEPWITPSIFQNTNDPTIVDEFTLGLKTTDYNATLAMLQNHWATWITEDDFIAINAAGLNHVRIPLGYWSVPLTSNGETSNGEINNGTDTSITPYIPGAWPYLLQALNWAAAHDVHVILDLHGAPGSQNGYDNSGQRTSDPQWALNPENITRTVDTLVYIVQEIGGMIDVIELVNESAGFISSTWAAVTRSFYSQAYTSIREAVGGDIVIMIGDAFLGVDSWTGFLAPPADEGVIMDNHDYQVFEIPELQLSFDGHLALACSTLSTLSSFAANNIWTIVGEWSTAVTDCAPWLNGRGIGARWDNSYNGGPANGSCVGWTGNYTTFSSEYMTFLRQYWETQADMGESAQGWLFWAWKTESSDEWSYSRGLEGGWIPTDPTERIFPNFCANSTTS